MFNVLTSLGLGVVIFGIVITLGSVILQNTGNSVGGTANTTAQYLNTQLGSTGGGLASWTPTIIVIGVAFVLLGYFGLGGKGKKGFN